LFLCSSIEFMFFTHTHTLEIVINNVFLNTTAFVFVISVILGSWKRTPDNGGKRNKTCWSDSVNTNMDSLEHQPWFFSICPWWVNNCYLFKLMIIIIFVSTLEMYILYQWYRLLSRHFFLTEKCEWFCIGTYPTQATGTSEVITSNQCWYFAKHFLGEKSIFLI